MVLKSSGKFFFIFGHTLLGWPLFEKIPKKKWKLVHCSIPHWKFTEIQMRIFG